MSGGKVGIASILFMMISLILSVGVPVAGIIYLGIKRRLNAKALLWGSVLFILFALVLEQLLHLAVLGTAPQKSVIFKNPLLYMLYGGLAAGIFEETARLLGFKLLIRVKPGESLNTGLSYGLGHGGIEAIFIGGLSMLNNFTYATMINSGTISSVIKKIPAAQQEVFQKAMDQLINLPAPVFLMTGLERVLALVIQISLSVLVLMAVTNKKWSFYFLAIGLHAVVDFAAVLYQKGILTSIYAVELIVLVLAAGIAWLVYKLAARQQPVSAADGTLCTESNFTEDAEETSSDKIE